MCVNVKPALSHREHKSQISVHNSRFLSSAVPPARSPSHTVVLLSPLRSTRNWVLSAGGQRGPGAQPGQTSAGDPGAHRAGELPPVAAEGGGAGGSSRGDAGRAQPQQRAGQGHRRRPGLQVEKKGFKMC